MKIGFIGIGNMGCAILRGFLNGGFNNENIFIYDVNIDKCESIKNQYKINVCSNLEYLIKEVNLLILAVKPDVILNLLSNVKEHIIKFKPTIVSIAAGTEISKISDAIGDKEISIFRVMPNINAEISHSTSSYCYVNLEQSEVDKIVSLFKSIGSVYYIPEEKFNIFTAIAGCGPAYVYLFLDSMAKGAQKLGLNKKEALNIAIDTLIGSAKMLKNSDKHCWELIDNVCSPGGITIEGVCILEENNFQQTIVKTIEKTVEKDDIIRKGKK